MKAIAITHTISIFKLSTVSVKLDNLLAGLEIIVNRLHIA